MLKTERLRIAENAAKKPKGDWNTSTSTNNSPSKKMKQRKKSFDQPTVTTVTEDEIERQGKDAILKNLKKNNAVAFPEPADLS
jgi:hypothetical protein